MSRRRLVVIQATWLLCWLAAAPAVSGTINRRSPIPFTPNFLSDAQAASAALAGLITAMYFAVGPETPPIRVDSPVERFEVSNTSLRFVARGEVDLGGSTWAGEGQVAFDLRSVIRVETYAWEEVPWEGSSSGSDGPTRLPNRNELSVVLADGREASLFFTDENSLLAAVNAICTLVAAGGGRLYESTGLVRLRSDEDAALKRRLKWKKKDLTAGIGLGKPLPSSPAERAGFMAGDIVLEIMDVPGWNGSALPQTVELWSSWSERKTFDQAISAVESRDSSGEVTIRTGVLTEGGRTIREFSLRDLAGLYAGPGMPRVTLGMSAVPVSAEDARRLNLPISEGLAVREVREGSIAERLGIRIDDVLIEINGRPVSTLEQMAEVLATIQDVQSAKVYRDGIATPLGMPVSF